MTKSNLSDVDTVNLAVYGIAQFIAGVIGDEFDMKKVLTLSFLAQSLIFGLISFTGFTGGSFSEGQFYIWFILLGLAQSVTFPLYVSITANWFSSKRRGLAVGSFCTCVNLGNIIGAQLG